jgi:hypothetical protein
MALVFLSGRFLGLFGDGFQWNAAFDNSHGIRGILSVLLAALSGFFERALNGFAFPTIAVPVVAFDVVLVLCFSFVGHWLLLE